MNKPPLKQTLRQLAEESIPPGTDLWPRIKAQLESAGMDAQPRNRKMRAAPVVALAALLAIVVLALATPPGRAWAQNLLGFFERAASDVSVPTAVPAPALDPAQIPAAVAAVEQDLAEDLGAGYSILLPTRLPEGWRLAAVEAGDDPGEAHVEFSYAGGGRLLELSIQPAAQLAGTIWGPPGEVVLVPVGEGVGEFVQGAWFTEPGRLIAFQILPEQAEWLEWISDLSLRRLRWQIGEEIFALVSQGGSAGHPGHLSAIDLVTIAESLAPVPVSAESWPEAEPFVPDEGRAELAAAPVEANLDLADLQAKFAFPLMVPTLLPPGYSFAGWGYVEFGRIAMLDFECGVPGGGGWWALRLEQQPLSDDDLSTDMLHSWVRVGASAAIETVPVWDVSGEYVQGDWVRVIDPLTLALVREEWNSVLNFHHLIWFRDGMLYKISTSRGAVDPSYAGACRVDKGAVLLMAESMK